MNIPYAYADLRFNPTFDRQTGFFTRSILCVPIVNKDNRRIGVTQVLNKKGGVFTDEQSAAFLRQPGAERAVMLRIWDDLAKTAGLPTPPLAHYLARARRCAL